MSPPLRTSPTTSLRLCPPNETDENLAVETAQRHATNTSLSWKQYVANLDFFLGLELEFEDTVGGFDCLGE